MKIPCLIFLQKAGYTTRTSSDFNLEYILDIEMLEQFIRNAQPDTWKKLEKQFSENTMAAVASEYAKI